MINQNYKNKYKTIKIFQIYSRKGKRLEIYLFLIIKNSNHYRNCERQTDSKREQYTYPVHARSLWHWAVDQIKNPLLAERIVWDACRLYKWNSVSWDRFVDEPCTANRWWNIQV